MPALLDAEDIERLRGWEGRTETLHDVVTAAPVRALCAALDRDDSAPGQGTPLPPLWHWLYFLPMHAAREIGDDGHPRRGGFLPPVPLPRRMWAGGRLAWETANPLRIGQAVRRVSRVASVAPKTGRTGSLVFATVVHEVHNDLGLALTEEHDIVYRGLAQAADAAPAAAAEQGAPWQRFLTPDEVLLFRYSALTFNGHRIHYDKPYATGTEGYPGLVVHGPLIATLLLDLLRRELPAAAVRRFSFKAVRPSFGGRALQLNGRREGGNVALWSQDHDGWLTMQAAAGIEQ